MSNQLLNKFKLIDNSRARLKSILANKGLETTSTSLPDLVEDVNQLTHPDIVGPNWEGLEIEPAPTDYYRPTIDLDAIYAADTSKNSYTNVIIMLFKVSNCSNDLVQNAIQTGNKYKFSDTNTLVNPATGTQSPAHTWNANKDIIGTDGERYRYVIVYQNTGTDFDYQGGYCSPEAMIFYKGTFRNIGWRDNYSAPVYTELKEDVIITGNINTGGTGLCNAPRTFICNAESAGFGDSTFNNCPSLEVFIFNSVYTNANSNQYLFYWCTSLRYIYFKEIYTCWYGTFAGVHDCYIQLDLVKGNFGLNERSPYNNNPSTLSYGYNNRIKIGTIKSYLGYLYNERDGLPYAFGGHYIDIGVVEGLIYALAFSGQRITFNGIKIHEIKGSIGEGAFEYAPLAGEILITSKGQDLYIGPNAFNGTLVTKIDISQSQIATLNNYAFANCDYLEEVLLCDAIDALGTHIFAFDPSLTHIDFANAVVSLTDYMFMGDIKLVSLVIPDKISSITSNTFRGSFIKSLTLGKGIVSLPANAFRYQQQLEEIVLPETFTALNDYCFAYTNIKHITLPVGVTSLAEYCFYNSNIETIEILGNIDTIRAYAFGYCKNLKSFNLDGVTTIYEYAFMGSGVEELELSETLANITTNGLRDVGARLKFNTNYTLNGSFDISGNKVNDSTVLDMLYSIPVMETGLNLTMTYTVDNGVTNATYSYATLLKDRYVLETETGLEWATASTSNAIKIANYLSAKNVTLV